MLSHHIFLSLVKPLEETWSVKFPGSTTSKVSIKPGKVTLDGIPVKTKKSVHKKFPSTHGWVTFKYKGLNYFMRRTSNGFLILRIDRRGKVVKGSAGMIFEMTSMLYVIQYLSLRI